MESIELVKIGLSGHGEPSPDVEMNIVGKVHEKEESKHSGYAAVVVKNAPATLTWKHLSVITRPLIKGKNSAVLLNNISGNIRGGFCAIMGCSGSGKTTLLSALALRIDPYRMVLTGELKLNNESYSKKILKSMSGYVLQDDIVHSHLTIAETLSFSGSLRMSSATTSPERRSRAAYLIDLMGLSHCQNTVVGDSRHKGISGGERKRLCIAIELLNFPSLLFLDEPTSGLDSANAYSVINVLKGLADRGECTVISSIHQPNSKIFNSFHNLILMRKGVISYQGDAAKAVDYFGDLGYPCPPLTNPADHIIDVLSENGGAELSHEQKAERDLRITTLDYHVYKALDSSDDSYGSFTPKVAQPWFYQLAVLLQRNIHFHYRNWTVFALNVFVTVVISLFTSLSVWQDIGTSRTSVSRRQPLLFFCVIHQGIVASLQGSHSFPLERAIMLRERAAGTYYVSAYFIAKTVADMLFQIPAPIIFTCIVYPITGLQPGARKFFTFMGFMILCSLSATSLANAVSCVFVNIELSTVVLAMAYEWVRLYGGWFISPAQIAFYPDWRFADVLSYIKYAFVGISLNENEGLVVNCKPSELVNRRCTVAPLSPTYTAPFLGEYFNEYYGYDEYSIGICFGALVVYIVAARLVAYLALRYIKI